MSDIFDSLDELRSDISESELSDTLNTTAFDTATHATAGSEGSSAASSLDNVVVNGKTYIVVGNTASLRVGHTASFVWGHGRELRLLGGCAPHKCWQCTYCGKVYPVVSTTAHAIAHLKKHGAVRPQEEAEGLPSRTISQQLGSLAYKALVTTVQATRFRYLLIRWIVCMHVALSIIEHHTFRDLMLYCCPAIEPFLVRTGTTMRKWVINEFVKQQLQIKKELEQSKFFRPKSPESKPFSRHAKGKRITQR